MFFISHRGNIDGKITQFENSIDYILTASENYDVEIDIWFYKNNFYFGHDEPKYLIDKSYLKSTFDKKKFWFHAKNFEALEKTFFFKKANFFWHQNDDFTITNKGYFWTYPSKQLSKKSICVLPEAYTKKRKFKNLLGICSDRIKYYKKYNN